MATGLGAGLVAGGLMGYAVGRSQRQPQYVYVVPATKVKVIKIKATTTRKKKKSTRKKKR
jgi:hypothetical protein